VPLLRRPSLEWHLQTEDGPYLVVPLIERSPRMGQTD
jgi:hypothetical protein